MNLSKKILTELINKKYIEEDKYNFYDYGMKVLIMNLLPILLVLTISIIVDDITYGIFFLLSFTPIRINLGGYHCSCVKKCLISFVMLFIITLFMRKLDIHILIKIVGFIAIVIFWFVTPLTNDFLGNYKEIYTKSKQHIKTVCVILFFILHFINNHSVIEGISMACILNVFLYFLGSLKKKKLI
ncbi:MAG: accessory gene regulator B family protein [Longibaculum muris]|uniref:Accessory gene regulator B n=1 Tax=Longibaculum muris TaxID=1796628 RepID=A0A4R3YHE9_9FIRM|nr:accessory gene regulator B family protein [Longibaculum muris]KXU43980.1 hypothetical protein HMPREF3037_02668 [Candidatus Stoquefichus sp. KLE1796]MBS5369066.1 accessory gene regulator B family protein [Coprobacillus cateniformis]MCR1889225.1 accessory gene regulator B family protein [Longibaculum muris]MED9813423.1 accessory gene regulator B family protein [Longibaculum muris]TCV91737.1 accessory gene regulator B [Longibaculum muris]